MCVSSLSYKTLLNLTILLLLISTKTFSQTDTINNTPDVERLSRYRLSLGGVNLLVEDDNYEFRHFFFNVSFRSSGFSKESSSFKIKFAFEPGINGLIIAQRSINNETEYDLFFVPYAKFGPEARIVKNLQLGISLGIIVASYQSTFGLLPFGGVNCYYLLEIKKNLYLEFETGFHTTYSPGDLPYFLYLTVGISLL